MKALKCEMCGSSDIIKKNGVFMCQFCKTKYSIDEAKKLLVEVEGTVQVDSSHLIDNYFSIATNAYIAKNYSEVESYCNKIIEVDPVNYKAWLLKGKAVAWASEVGQLRFAETIVAFTNSFSFCPIELKNDLFSEISGEIFSFAKAWTELRISRFKKLFNDAERLGILNDVDQFISLTRKFSDSIQTFLDDIQLQKELGEIISSGARSAYSDVWDRFYGDDGHPSDFEFSRFVTEADNCILLITRAIDLCVDDYDENILRYKFLIAMQEDVINSCSYVPDFFDYWNNCWKYKVSRSLAYQALQIRREIVSNYNKKISDINGKKSAKQKEEAEKRYNEYWAKHSEEKKEMEISLSKLISEKKAFETELNSISDAEKVQREELIRRMAAEKSRLGLFKIKEKKELQNEIDIAQKELTTIIQKIEQERNPIKKKIDEIQRKINKINTELKKPR